MHLYIAIVKLSYIHIHRQAIIHTIPYIKFLVLQYINTVLFSTQNAFRFCLLVFSLCVCKLLLPNESSRFYLVLSTVIRLLIQPYTYIIYQLQNEHMSFPIWLKYGIVPNAIKIIVICSFSIFPFMGAKYVSYCFSKFHYKQHEGKNFTLSWTELSSWTCIYNKMYFHLQQQQQC